MGNKINKSLVIAYKILKDAKSNLEFAILWKKVAKEIDAKEKDFDIMAEFYTSLLLDRRFVMVGNNIWSLRRNFKFSDIVVEIESVYDNDEIDEPEEIVDETTIPELLENSTDEILENIKNSDDTNDTNEDLIVEHIEDDDNTDDEFVANENSGFEEIIIPKK